MIVSRLLAFVAVGSLAALKLVPINLRPAGLLTHTGEHVLPYFLTGILIAFASRLKPLVTLLAIVALAGILELSQVLSPTRHARFSDFLFDAGGAILGAMVVYVMRLKAEPRLHKV